MRRTWARAASASSKRLGLADTAAVREVVFGAGGIVENARPGQLLVDFSSAERVACTYDEHGAILRAIECGQSDQAAMLLQAHIEASKAEVRKITLHRLYTAHNRR